MSIFITGDTHGEFTRFGSTPFREGRELTENDIVIILGDFGGIWDVNESRETELYWLDWLASKKWTTLFVDGNHENFDRLNALPQVIKFGGLVSPVHKNKIFRLHRGEIFEIEGKKFFVMGGGQSIDKAYRTEFISWWPDELPSYNDYQRALHNLDKHNWKVDVILSHTAPYHIVKKLEEQQFIFGKANGNDLQKFFDDVYDKCDFKKWFCGHFHIDDPLYIGGDKFIFMYQLILNLEYCLK